MFKFRFHLWNERCEKVARRITGEPVLLPEQQRALDYTSQVTGETFIIVSVKWIHNLTFVSLVSVVSDSVNGLTGNFNVLLKNFKSFPVSLLSLYLQIVNC